MKDQIIKILDEEIRKLIKEQMGVGDPGPFGGHQDGRGEHPGIRDTGN